MSFLVVFKCDGRVREYAIVTLSEKEIYYYDQDWSIVSQNNLIDVMKKRYVKCEDWDTYWRDISITKRRI